ncbi:hypothetical protein ACQ27_gp093 [Klebsiella phage K64-1]|nr:hypothetical protein ACQ27_gp093 [Klebsiella phage K64-1]
MEIPLCTGMGITGLQLRKRMEQMHSLFSSYMIEMV